MAKKVFLVSDHAGYPLKIAVADHLSRQNIPAEDLGAHSPQSVDYPLFAEKLAQALLHEPAAIGIAICGSGNGICMALNRFAHVRAALCWTPQLARLARQHNNANVLCLSGWFTSVWEARAIVDAFLNSEFEGGRHERRVAMLERLGR